MRRKEKEEEKEGGIKDGRRGTVKKGKREEDERRDGMFHRVCRER